ncbi:DUF2867 domain-containing protein [Nonomuraea sp. NN258]|uniref:DUF2867 domain-containing protein n=1 Tax=Nonomuraea antri TaxID=2730852 RepID=UPI001568AFEB|nr:DUF2867 domain-containing protein [Nonomuraea antri]NRQ32543.1 DUF2867 domain-containing protein [Nonomuraea antri]
MSRSVDPPALRTLVDGADLVDVRTIDGQATLRAFAAGALGWAPWWLRGLYLARGVFARLLRTAHPDVRPGSDGMTAADIPFEPGRRIGFFRVVDAVEERYLLLSASDSHLAAHLALVAEPENRFRLVTVVKYLHWTGRLYFAVIRPFHAVVVRGMARAGISAGRTSATPGGPAAA